MISSLRVTSYARPGKLFIATRDACRSTVLLFETAAEKFINSFSAYYLLLMVFAIMPFLLTRFVPKA